MPNIGSDEDIASGLPATSSQIEGKQPRYPAAPFLYAVQS
jgi:hypothetical protein